MKPHKETILFKDTPIDYQTLIEEVVGEILARHIPCYYGNWDKKSVIDGHEVDRDRAHFVPKHDYEIIIRKKIKS